VTDEQPLIDRAQQGDGDAFRQLVERSNLNVYRLAYDMTGNRHDAEDLVQEVYIRAYRSLGNFRREAKWSTWLYRITINICLDHRNSKARKPLEYSDSIEDDTQSERAHARVRTTPDRETESSMIRENIERALSTLAPQERSVFVLRHYHDLPLKEIADTLQVAEGTVKSHLFRALQKLREELAFYRNDLGLEN
jgi:RNA polymerase sigma-70 factor, ECF subfamily